MENLDELIRKQRETTESLTKLSLNFRKDSSSRKTAAYYNKKLVEIDELWQNFLSVHENITKLVSRDHPYLSQQILESTKSLYDQTKAVYIEGQNALEICPGLDAKTPTIIPSTATGVEPATIFTLASTETTTATLWTWPSTITTTASYTCGSPQVSPVAFTTPGNAPITSAANVHSQYWPSYQPSSLPRLPPLEIPRFNGDYRSWKCFSDMFNNVIHTNPSIGPIQKMQYLLNYLDGDARDAISHLTLDGSNYEAALTILQDRFCNNRKMITAHIDTILDAERIAHRCPKGLLQLYDSVRNCLAALKNLQYKTEEWDPLIVRIVMRKLDNEGARLFEESLDNLKQMPTLNELYKFLLKRHQTLTLIRQSNNSQQPTVKKNSYMSAVKQANKDEKFTCIYCRTSEHLISRCQHFKALSIDERQNFVTTKGLCRNCISHDKATKCKSKHKCFECNKPHHTLLHYSKAAADNMTANIATMHVKCQPTIQTRIRGTVLLATALINIATSTGIRMLFRALVDPGSQTSFISSKAAKKIGMHTEDVVASITGIGGTETKTVRKRGKISIAPRFTSDFAISTEALIMPKLTSVLPEQSITIDKANTIQSLRLADPTFTTPGTIDVILGADVFADIIQNGLKKEARLVYQKTRLGWIVSGKVMRRVDTDTQSITSMVSMAEFHNQMEKFFEADADDGQRELSTSEERCEEMFQCTHERDNNGRYVVHLPFKDDNDLKPLGESRNTALLRYRQVEKRLRKNPALQKKYNDFLQEYLELGHMERALPYVGDERNVYYLPHHPVFKEESSTTKLRVVFDASAKTSSGSSLNNLLHTGVKLQQDLSQILLRWRKYKYVFTADIEKMFRQIQVAEADRDYQRILWRQHETGCVDEYRLNTVTYGTAAATFLAVRSLIQLADDESQNYPYAATVLKTDFYVDDLLTGAHSLKSAEKLQAEMLDLLAKGGFNLRKWTANAPELLATIREDAKEPGLLELMEDPFIKTLGVRWNPATDQFQFKILDFGKDKRPSKRQLLSNIATIYDPLQWLAPVTVKAKLLMQKIWKTGIDWDEVPNEAILTEWEKLSSELHLLEQLRIPRWTNYESESKIELHGFCDASEVAYAAAVYSKVFDSSGRITIRLLCAKTRVAPIKSKITLPKMELNGALLLANLLDETKNSLNISGQIYAWSDSTIVLAWLKKDPTTLETYVANRTSKIQKKDAGSWTWRHVKSDQNPADCASRGINPNELINHTLWWNGPIWLRSDIKENIVATSMITAQSETPFLERFSDYTKLVKTMACCLRFIHNTRYPKKQRRSGRIEAQELDDAQHKVITTIQRCDFHEEIKELETKGVSKRLKSLSPFIDKNGILRVGGRLQNADISEDAKHPILLPQRHHVTHLIVRAAHKTTMHGGLQLVRNYLRMRYWIINDQKVIRHEIHRCLTCCKYASKQNHQLMGNLPAVRVTPSHAFTHCGVDYAGPFKTRMAKGRGTTTLKGYIALFICMVTKAIHLELVSDLSTEAFLAAFKRFVSRRGVCKEIFSDNGTNFVGAHNQLDHDIQLAIERSTNDLARITARDGITWKFIPVNTPHFGGLWEAGVKSTKGHIKRLFDEMKIIPTFEEFTTTLCQIEACLNSRPITAISSDPNDLQALTPGHFLIGRPMMALPEPDRALKSLHERWKILSATHQIFWNRWSTEYLHSLQQRTKWATTTENPRVGELVLIKERDTPPMKWPLARIHELQPGPDGKVRTVMVRYHGDKLKQVALVNLCRLPVEVPADSTSVSVVSVHAQKRKRPAPKVNPPKLKKQAPEQRPSNPPKKIRIAPCNWARNLLNIAIMLLSLLAVGATNTSEHSFEDDFHIFTPDGGLYVEKLGYTRIMRGNLRLEATLPTKDILQDKQDVLQTWAQAKDMCRRTKELSSLTHCDTLLVHLEGKRNQLLQMIAELLTIPNVRSRKRRGLFGKLLTNVFGVNDEVYEDIDTLKHNQQNILRTTTQQAILLNSRITHSNMIMSNKLKQFGINLNHAIDMVNGMNKWYTKVDHNKISVQVLATYLTAADYYEEIELKYSKLTNMLFGYGNILDFLTLENLNKTLDECSTKLGPHFMIIRTPQKRSSMQRSEDGVTIYGYFSITEALRYDLIHVTSFPHKIQEHQYLAMMIKNPTIAVNFNHLTYFDLTEQQLKECTIQDRDYLCKPNMVNTMQTNPSCILDELYNRHNRKPCPTISVEVNQTQWKELMMPNTWLFVADTPTVATIICKGVRHEAVLENIGILRTSSNCVVHTGQFTLQSSLEENKKVIASFSKAIPVEKLQYSPVRITDRGKLARVSDQLFDEDFTEPKLPTTTLEKIREHAGFTALTIISIIAVGFIFLKCKRLFQQWRRTSKINTAQDSSIPEDQQGASTSLEDKFNVVLAARGPACS